MTSQGGLWPTSNSRSRPSAQTSNSQYGQWFDGSRQSSAAAVNYRQLNASSATLRPLPAQHAAQSPAASRDLTTSSSSSYDLSGTEALSAGATQTSPHNVSWRSLSLPLSLQRSSTTLGLGSRLSTSVSGVDDVSGLSHADLVRDYRCYRQLQAGIAADSTPWRTNSRLHTRTATSSGTGSSAQTGSTSSPHSTPAPNNVQQRTASESTTVVPLQLNVGGPLPLQRSTGNVISTRRPMQAEWTPRRPHTGYSALNRPSISSFPFPDNYSPSPDTPATTSYPPHAAGQFDGYETTARAGSTTSAFHSSQHEPSAIHHDMSTHDIYPMTNSVDYSHQCNAMPTRSILKKPASASAGFDRAPSGGQATVNQSRPSFTGAASTCHHPGLQPAHRTLPVAAAAAAAERARTVVTSKRVTFCV